MYRLFNRIDCHRFWSCRPPSSCSKFYFWRSQVKRPLIQAVGLRGTASNTSQHNQPYSQASPTIQSRKPEHPTVACPLQRSSTQHKSCWSHDERSAHKIYAAYTRPRKLSHLPRKWTNKTNVAVYSYLVYYIKATQNARHQHQETNSNP